MSIVLIILGKVKNEFMTVFFFNFAKSSLVDNNVINIVFQDVKHLTLNRRSCIITVTNIVTQQGNCNVEEGNNESCLSCLCGKGTTVFKQLQTPKVRLERVGS